MRKLKIILIFLLNQTTVDPEKEYDEKYVQNSKNTTPLNQPKNQKYSKVIVRKR